MLVTDGLISLLESRDISNSLELVKFVNGIEQLVKVSVRQVVSCLLMDSAGSSKG